MTASLAERLPGVFLKEVHDQPVTKLFVNPVLWALARQPELVVIWLDRKHGKAGLMALEAHEDADNVEQAAIVLEKGAQGVPFTSISKYMASNWGILPGHHLAWEEDGIIYFELRSFDLEAAAGEVT